MSENCSCKTEKTHSRHSTPDFLTQMRENGKRRLWLFALLSFVLLLCYPLMTALTLNRYTGDDISTFIMRQGLGHRMLGLTGGGTVFLLTIGGILCAVEGFSWIYSRKKIDMYLSQPITAGRRFLMTYINGILIYFIPYIISLLMTLLVIAGAGAASGALFVNVLFTLPSALIYFLAVYDLTLVAMMISGKRGMAGFFILMGFLYDTLLRVVLESYCTTYFSTYAGRVGDRQFISPISRMVVMLDKSSFAWGAETVTAGMVVESLILPLLPGILALFTEAVIFGVIAYACYKKRPMEAVSQAVAFPVVKGPVKVLLTVLAGLLGSECFCDISGSNRFLVAFPGLVLGTLFCQALLEILYESDLKAFLRHKKSFAAGAVLTVLTYLFFSLDISGYDTWVPKQEDVESAAIQIYFNNNYCFDYVDEKGALTWSDGYGLDTMEMTDVSGVLSLAGDGMGKNAPEQNPETTLRCDVKYNMKNGKEKHRSFLIDYEREKTVLDVLFANKEYKEETYQVLSGQRDWIWERSRVYYSNGLQEKEIVDKNALSLMRAYQQDLREMSFSDVKDTVPCGTLALRYRTDDLDEFTLEYPVFPSYTRTVEYLRGKNVELYLNINPTAVDSIRFVRYSEEDHEVMEKGTFFGTSVATQLTEKIVEKEYTEKAQIGEILGYIYPVSLMRWVYVPDSFEESIGVYVQEADNVESYSYNWNNSFLVKKGELPEFVKEDIEVGKEKDGE